MSKKKPHVKKKQAAKVEMDDDFSAIIMDADDDGSLSRKDIENLKRLVFQTSRSFAKSATDLLETFKKRSTLTIGFALMDFYENLLNEADLIKRLQCMYLIFRVRELDTPLKKKSIPSMIGHPFATFFLTVRGSRLSPSYCDFIPTLYERQLAYFVQRPDVVAQSGSEFANWTEMSADTFASTPLNIALGERMVNEMDNMEVCNFYAKQVERFPCTVEDEGCPPWITILDLPEGRQSEKIDIVSFLMKIQETSKTSFSYTGLPPKWLPVIPGTFPTQDIERGKQENMEPQSSTEQQLSSGSFLTSETPTPVSSSAAIVEPVDTSAKAHIDRDREVTPEYIKEICGKILAGMVIGQHESHVLAEVIRKNSPEFCDSLSDLKCFDLVKVPFLVQSNSKIAGEVLAYSIREGETPEKQAELLCFYMSILLTMEMKVQSLETTSKMFQVIPDLDKAPLIDMIRQTLSSCRKCNNQSYKARFIRVTAYWLLSLYSDGTITPEVEVTSEVLQFCLEFSQYKIVSQLFQKIVSLSRRHEVKPTEEQEVPSASESEKPQSSS